MERGEKGSGSQGDGLVKKKASYEYAHYKQKLQLRHSRGPSILESGREGVVGEKGMGIQIQNTVKIVPIRQGG